MNVRVLDLSWHGPGHLATRLLASLGADVVKVEAPDGSEWTRTFPPIVDGASLMHLTVDRGKRSLAVDLRRPDGRDAFLAVADRADAVVVGMRPGAPERLGIGCKDLWARNRALTYCEMPGYGAGGPMASAAGHDLNYMALAGVLSLSATGAPPAPPPLQAADLLSTTLTAVAVLAGVVQARETGEGMHVETSLYDAARACVSMATALHLIGEDPQDMLKVYGNWACYGVYACADGGFMSLGALEPHFWRRFCELTGLEEWIDRQYELAAQDELRACVAEVFAGRTRGEWETRFAGEDVCAAPVLDVAEALVHPQAMARGTTADVVQSDGHRTPVPVGPFTVSGQDRGAAVRVPALGEHTEQLLLEAGLPAEQIRRLAEAGAIALATRR